MSYRVQGVVDGLPQLLASLDGLATAVRNRILRAAVMAAGKVVLSRAKADAPRESGLLRKSMARKVKVYRNSGVAVAIVGPRKGYKQQVTRKRGKWRASTVWADPVRYAHLVELGTRPHRQRGGQHPGSMPRPFLTPAATQQATAIRAAMASAINEGLAKAVAQGRA